MIKLYGMSGSGNCYKPALLMSHLNIRYQWIEIDVLGGATRKPEFLALNANGKVPLLEISPEQRLAESNAMLCYLAEGSDWLPQDQWQRAKVMEWLFFEQYSHEPNIATVRFWIKYNGKRRLWRDRIAQTLEKGYAALTVMEQRLAQSDWLVADRPSIADIALYAYTHVAHQGDYDMNRFPAIQAWMQRLSAIPRHLPMDDAE